MRIVTPSSNLFQDNAASLVGVSQGVEYRPEIFGNVTGLGWQSSIERIHFSRRDTDANFPWSKAARDFIVRSIEQCPEEQIAVSFHLAADTRNVETDARGRFRVLGDVVPETTMLTSASANVAWLKKRFPKVSVLLENNNYYPTGAYELVTRGDFIGRVCAETESGLLFDWAHAVVTAGNRGEKLTRYLEELPLALMEQIHLSRPKQLGVRDFQDSHGLPSLKDLKTCLKSVKLSPSEDIDLTVEYYSNIGELKSLLETFRRWFGERRTR